jgi:hypothetical protein
VIDSTHDGQCMFETSSDAVGRWVGMLSAILASSNQSNQIRD